MGKVYEKNKDKNIFYREAAFYSTKELLRDIMQDHGFKKPEMIQTVFGKLSENEVVQSFKEGYGEGGFVLSKAI